MPRVKRGKISMKRRRNVLKRTKGFKNALKSKERQAKTALAHAGVHAFNDRRKKKGVMRRLSQVRINAAVRELGTTYGKFIAALKRNNVALDRKVLAELAAREPKVFEKIYEKIVASS